MAWLLDLPATEGSYDADAVRVVRTSMTSTDTFERLRAICAKVGFDLARVDPTFLARLELLAETTQTVGDAERMADLALRFFRYYDTTKPREVWRESERRVVVLGCLFSDIGKTGPGSADPGGQRLIVEMFAVEGVRDEAQPVTRFMETHFPRDAEQRVRAFAGLALDPKMPIREFWNLHSRWTLEIVEAGGIPADVVAAAATHHLLDDINPAAIVASDHRFTRPFGDNVAFDRAEKLIILLDKYDALRRRGRRTHEQAISWLRKRVDESRRFSGDVEFSTLIVDLDVAARP